MSTPNPDQRMLAYVDALSEAVAQEMSADERVFVMGLDVDDHKAIQGSTRGLLDKFGPDRVYTTPNSEDAMTGVAIGAAMAGMRPIHVHIRMDFLLLCMNQLINIAAKSHYMYGGQVKAPLVVRSMIGKSWGQGAQHSQALYSMFMHVPGLKVVAPSNAYDAKGAMIAAIRDDNPVMFVEHRLLYPVKAAVPEEPYVVEPGKGRIWRRGKDITIVAISNMVVETLKAAELLAEIGIDAEVIDPIWLQPLDHDLVVESVAKTGRLLVADNAWLNCGASAEIAARVAEHFGDIRAIPIRRIGFAETTCPPSPRLEKAFYPGPSEVAIAAYKMVKHHAPAWTPDSSKAALAYQEAFKGPF